MTTTVRGERKVDEVAAWRRDQLIQAGFPLPLADRAARDARFDLHALIQLVERGCAPELAVRIASPLGEGRVA